MLKVDYEYGQWFVYKRGKRISQPFASHKEASDHMDSLTV